MKLLKLTPLTLALAITTGVTAQEQEPLETITVEGTYVDGYQTSEIGGASKLQLSVFEIPQSVSVISSAQMEDFQLTDLNSAVETATGVNVERIETDRTYYTARGFDITNFQIDGIGLPLTSGNNHSDEDTAIYERIEVIRGANGLMTGVGNPSATINFIRKRPEKQRNINIAGTLGSWDDRRLELDSSVPLTDALGARLIAVKQKANSYLDRYSKDKTMLYGMIEFDVTDYTKLSFSHSYNESTGNGNNWGANPLYYTDGSPTNYDVSTTTSADWSFWNVTKNNSVFELAHSFNNDWNLRATYSFKTIEEDTELFYVYGTPDAVTELGLNGWASEYDNDEEHHLLDAYVSGKVKIFGNEHDLIFGVNRSELNYEDLSLYDYTTGNGFPVMPSLLEWDGGLARPTFADGAIGSDVERTQEAAYFTARIDFGRGVKLLTGGRYNNWQAKGESYGVVQDADDSEFIPYLGLVYQFAPNLMAYASYTETFVSQTELDINNRILDPITGESKELGFKGDWFEGNLITSLAYFDTQQVNLATLDPRTANLPADQFRYIGSDGIRSTGIEIEVAGRIGNNLQLSAGYTNFDIDNNELVASYTPESQLKLAGVYELNKLSIGLNLRWQDDISRVQGTVGDSFSNAGEIIVTEQNAYTIVDLMASYDFSDNLTLSMNANNVTDEKYIASLYWAQGYYGAPSHYSATLRWEF